MIPKYVTKKIEEQKIKEEEKKGVYKATLATEDFREKRKKIQDRIRNGEDPKSFLNLVSNHKEQITVYNNNNSWDTVPNQEMLWEDFIQDHTIPSQERMRPRRVFTKKLDEVHDTFHDRMNRESFDNSNAAMISFIKYGKDYNNAYWDGEYLVFGTGDKYYFRDFTLDYTTVCHELGHAIQQYESNLIYKNQSGALNEHLSDVLAMVAYQYKYDMNVSISKWVIGEKVFTTKISAKGLRTFKNEPAYDDPLIGKDLQPKMMQDYVNTDDDDGGVHINSGIPNHAFYVYNTKLGNSSYSWTNGSFEIWYNTMLKSSGLSADATFGEFARRTLSVSDKLGKDTSKLEAAWKEVGVI